ncbi:DUF4197 domain-containing protein [Thermophagus sp. OGC60D27]|uniref:DUF4197 domain-containing protein n=1 Tax=Thermophagus sp. OGC60D27 TaxID=3458415 RepID=UPI004038178E
MRKFVAFIPVLLVFTACAELSQVVKDMNVNQPLTQNEVISGLKQALVIGADSAAKELSGINGYYGDERVKISLPPQAQTITQNLSKIPGGDKMVEDVLLRINRAAEDAARDAAPIFANAISKMTIQDGFKILNGNTDAATQYLKMQTYDELYNLYQPKIKASVGKKLVGNISTSDAWETLTGQWNRIAHSFVGQMADLESVEVELDRYLTEQALNGLFVKLAMEEAEIRTNTEARVTDLLRRVFGRANTQ